MSFFSRGNLKDGYLVGIGVLLIGLSIACAPEPQPMTVDEVCGAYDEMEENTPRPDEAEVANYQVVYYQDWAQRIDGALGAAFADLAEQSRSVLEGSETDTLEYSQATRTVWRICKWGPFSEEWRRGEAGADW